MIRLNTALCALFASGVLTGTALADDFTITGPETTTNGGNTLNGGDTITVTSTGSVTTTGVSEYGLSAGGNGNTLTNAGTLTTDGDIGFAIVAAGDNNTLINNGTITTNKISGMGFFVFGHGNTVSNRGTVTTNANSAFGIAAFGNNNTVTNSGTIRSQRTYSVQMEGANATLNLNQGSVLNGDVHFNTPASATLNFGAGLNAVVKTDASIPATITSKGVYTVAGDTIYNTDLSDIAAQNRAASAAGRLMFDAVEARGRTPVVTRGGSDGRWASLNAGVVSNPGDDDIAGYQGAVLSGNFGRDLGTGGMFGGVSVSRMASAGNVDTNGIGVQGGIYDQWGAAEYTLAAGVSVNATERTRANNTIVGGVERASANNISVFVSPSLSWNGVLSDNDSLRLRYAGVWTGAQDFDFAAGDLAVGSHFNQMVEARMAWARPLEANALRYGVDLGWQNSQDLDLTLAGNALTSAAPGKATYGRVFMGMDFAHGGIEAGYDSNKELTAKASYTLKF